MGAKKGRGEGLRSVGGVPFLALPPPALRLARLSNLKKFTDGTTTRSSDAPAHHRIGNDGLNKIAKPSTSASSTIIIDGLPQFPPPAHLESHHSLKISLQRTFGLASTSIKTPAPQQTQQQA